MTKIFNLDELSTQAGGEYVLGLKALKTHAVYMVYGSLKPGDDGRKLLPGKGHEEILCITMGEVVVDGLNGSFIMKSGEAFHLREDDEYHLKNESEHEVKYVLAGGHPPVQHK